MSWQRHNGCYFVSFVIYISGAKFQEHCFNIFRDILDWVLNCFSGSTYDVITYNTKTWISLKRKKIFQKGKRHSSLLWKAFQISRNYFLLHRHWHFRLPSLNKVFLFIYFFGCSDWSIYNNLSNEINCNDHFLKETKEIGDLLSVCKF